MLSDRAREHKLIDAVRAAPDEDAPRLVYADALLERGDRRGDLVLLQCALAQGDVPRKQAIALRRRARGIEDEQLHALPAIFDELDPKFRRGFIERITVDVDRFLAGAKELLAHAPLLREVRLTGLVARSEEMDVGLDAMLPALAARLGRVLDHRGIDGVDIVDARVSWATERERWDQTYRGRESAEAGPPLVQWLLDTGRLSRLKRLGFRGESIAALARSPHAAGLEHLAVRAGSSWLVEPAAPSSFLRPRGLRVDGATIAMPSSLLDRVVTLRTDAGFRQLPELLRSPALARLEELHLETRHYEVQPHRGNRPRSVRPPDPPVELRALLDDTMTLPRLKALSLVGANMTPELARDLLRAPLAAQLEVLDLRGSPALAPLAGPLRKAWDGILLLDPHTLRTS